MDSCFFCKIQSSKDSIIWESDLLFAIYDMNPVSPGHTLIIPKRHVVDLKTLSEKEWVSYKVGIQETLSINERTDFRNVYNKFIKLNISKESIWFCKKALVNAKVNTKPDAYNYGINDGKEAGRTIDHFHWHIIPRFNNDMEDPTGGIRYVIPEMGNYKIPRK